MRTLSFRDPAFIANLTPAEEEGPPVTSGLIACWEAGNIVGLNDGDPVATWPDTSGSSRDATQSDSAKRPLFKTGIFGSQPSVRFDGSNDQLDFTGTGITAVTLAMVWNAITWPGADAFSGPITWQPGSGTGFIYGEIDNNVGTGKYWTHMQYVGVGQARDTNTTITIGTKLVTIIRSSAMTYATTNFRQNGTSPSLSNTGYASGWPVATNLGNAYTPMNIDIGACLIYDRAVDDTEQTAIENYLNGKYAVY
jgi:hypothetical protein